MYVSLRAPEYFFNLFYFLCTRVTAAFAHKKSSVPLIMLT